SADRQAELAMSCERLAAAMFHRGDSDGAVELNRRALKLREKLAADMPGDRARQTAVASTQSSLGAVMYYRRDEPAQWAAQNAALAIRRKLNTTVDAPPKARADLATSLLAAAQIADTQGDSAAAREHLAEALAIAEQFVRDDPSNATWAKLLSD